MIHCPRPSIGMAFPLAQCYLYAASQAADIDQRADLFTITLHESALVFWQTALEFHAGKIIYQVRRALEGLNYLVTIEFEIFRNVLAAFPSKGIARRAIS